MSRKRKKQKKIYQKKFGKPPGSLIYTGLEAVGSIGYTIFSYDEQNLKDWKGHSWKEASSQISKAQNQWIIIKGLSQPKEIQEIGIFFNIHPLALEDILNLGQRTKIDEYEHFLLIICHSPFWIEETLEFRQVSIVLLEKKVLTFIDNSIEAISLLEQRLKKNMGRIRKSDPSYLVYAILDLLGDQYFLVLETIQNSIEDLETQMMAYPQKDYLVQIHHLNSKVLLLRKYVLAFQDMLRNALNSENTLLSQSHSLYFRDLRDHLFHMAENINLLRGLLDNKFQTYLSLLNQRTNEIMKVLTMVSTIFIPLTFIAGIYGMNFKHMPELEWKWGYPSVLIIMALLAGIMMYFFYKKGWIGSSQDEREVKSK
ncbi:MAG: magnesium and cobalt transport protein CorA [Planctomycetota bacterium]|nr:MAG: magnesium and cobalt transport protein CorA [Planctomycetota bacterium]